MPAVIITPQTVSHFQSSALKLLKLKGMDVEGDPGHVLMEFLSRPTSGWLCTVKCPIAGHCYTRKDTCKDYLFNCKLRSDKKTPLKTVIRIGSVHGITAWVDTESHAAAPEGESEDRTMVVLATDELLLLVDVLPGTLFPAVSNIWAVEKAPGLLLDSRPSRIADMNALGLTLKQLVWPKEQPPKSWYAASCESCTGTGECQTCNESGQITCSKCNGSGDYYTDDGNRYDCNPCEGSGELTCRRCEGSKCCRSCDGTGLRALEYRLSSATFHRKRQDSPVPAEIVKIHDWEQGFTVPTKEFDFSELVGALQQHTSGEMPAQIAGGMGRLAEAWRKINGCYDNCDELDSENLAWPIAVRNRRPSERRSDGNVYYEFDIADNSHDWSKATALPWKSGLPVELEAEDGPVVFAAQNASFNESRKLQYCTFVEFKPDQDSPSVTIRFDVNIDPNSIPESFFIQLLQGRAPHYQIRRHLEKFLGSDNDEHTVLRALVANGSRYELPQDVRPIKSTLAENKKQINALRMAMSEMPLVLVKGPPGTGKTTLIVEIIQQQLNLGKRVLVCSQTHQAVRNVMERLDQEGIPMLRYVNDDKATDIDRKYSIQSLSDEYESIREKIEQNVVDLKQKSTDLQSLANICKEARQAEAKHANVTRRLDGDESRILSNALRRKEAIEAECAINIKSCDEKTSAELTATTRERRHQDAQHQRLESQRTSLETVRDELIAALGARETSGKKNTLGPALVSRCLVKIGFYSWASTEDLRLSLTQKEKALAEISKNDTLVRREIVRLKSSLAEIEARAERNKRVILSSRDADLARVDAKTEDLLSYIRRKRSDADHEYLPSISKARTALKSTDAVALEDTGSPDWNHLNSVIEKKKEEVNRRLTWIETWRLSLIKNGHDIRRELFESVSVFFSTCVGLASWKALHNGAAQAIDMVIIDEAGKATVPETVIPAYYAKRLILIGDDMQLPPVRDMRLQCRPESCKKSHNEKTCWLESSLFEQLWREKSDQLGIMLDTQHRMHRVIAEFVSEVFYAGRLRSPEVAPHGSLIFEPFTRAVCLVPTMAWGNTRHEEYERRTGGYRNDLEAEIVARILERAKQTLDRKASVGIIAPYALQKELIREKVRNLTGDGERLKFVLEDVDSIDSFQGGERDIIIISFTRSPKLKQCNHNGYSEGTHDSTCSKCDGSGWVPEGSKFSFLLDLRRLNVAFSRARCMLILVGDIDALTNPVFSPRNSEGRESIKRFQEYVQDRGRTLHVWEAGIPNAK